MDVYSSVDSQDNDWLQGIHISLLHVIISDMCIPCCGRYTTEDSEAPEILSYEEISGVNISSEPVLKIQITVMGIFRLGRQPIKQLCL